MSAAHPLLDARAVEGHRPTFCRQGPIHNSWVIRSRATLTWAATPPARASEPWIQAGRSSGFRAADSWSRLDYWPRLLNPQSVGSMALCSVRSRLQRRGRSGFAPDSLSLIRSGGSPTDADHSAAPRPVNSGSGSLAVTLSFSRLYSTEMLRRFHFFLSLPISDALTAPIRSRAARNVSRCFARLTRTRGRESALFGAVKHWAPSNHG